MDTGELASQQSDLGIPGGLILKRLFLILNSVNKLIHVCGISSPCYTTEDKLLLFLSALCFLDQSLSGRLLALEP